MTIEFVGGARCGEREEAVDTAQAVSCVLKTDGQTFFGQYTRTEKTSAGRVIFEFQGWH